MNAPTTSPEPDAVREALETSERLHRYHNNLPEAELCSKALAALSAPVAGEVPEPDAVRKALANRISSSAKWWSETHGRENATIMDLTREEHDLIIAALSAPVAGGGDKTT